MILINPTTLLFDDSQSSDYVGKSYDSTKW